LTKISGANISAISHKNILASSGGTTGEYKLLWSESTGDENTVTAEIAKENKCAFAVCGKRREDLLEILSAGKTVQSFCLEEICMEHIKENMSRKIYFCNKTKTWKILSLSWARKLKENLCTVLSVTKVNCCGKGQVVTLTVYWIISTLIQRVQTSGL